jgi:hypothetical protein
MPAHALHGPIVLWLWSRSGSMAWNHEPTAGVIHSLEADACSHACMEVAVEAESGYTCPCNELMSSGVFAGGVWFQHGVRRCVDMSIFNCPEHCCAHIDSSVGFPVGSMYPRICIL